MQNEFFTTPFYIREEEKTIKSIKARKAGGLEDIVERLGNL